MSSRRKKGKKRRGQAGDSSCDDASDTRTQVGSDRTVDSLAADQDLGTLAEHMPSHVVDQRAALDEHLSDLSERKKPIRLQALRALQAAFRADMNSEFLLTSNETLVGAIAQCLRKGESTELVQALQTLSVVFFALASVELEHSERKLTEAALATVMPILDRLLATHSNSRVRANAATTMSIGSLCATSDAAERLRVLDSVQAFWLTDSHAKKFQGNVKVREKVVAPELSVAALDAWCLLASAVEDRVVVDTLFPKVSPLIVKLLAHDSLEVRIAAGRLAALLFASIYAEAADLASGDVDLPEATDDILERLTALASDANRAQSRDKRREQRTNFRTFQATVESGEEPSQTISLKGGRITFSGWPQLVQLDAVRKCLKTGFDQHLHNNLFLIDLFSIEDAFDSEEFYEDKSERRLRARERHDYKKSQRQRKNAFQYAQE